VQHQREADGFFRRRVEGGAGISLGSSPGDSSEATADTSGDTLNDAYQTVMIDQGFCFNAGEWDYPDAPLRGLYTRNRVYEGVIGMESFGPWTARLQTSITERVMDELIREIPSQWYEDDYDAVTRLLEQLLQRRSRVPEFLLAAKRSNRQPFPNWR